MFESKILKQERAWRRLYSGGTNSFFSGQLEETCLQTKKLDFKSTKTKGKQPWNSDPWVMCKSKAAARKNALWKKGVAK